MRRLAALLLASCLLAGCAAWEAEDQGGEHRGDGFPQVAGGGSEGRAEVEPE